MTDTIVKRIIIQPSDDEQPAQDYGSIKATEHTLEWYDHDGNILFRLPWELLILTLVNAGAAGGDVIEPQPVDPAYREQLGTDVRRALNNMRNEPV